MYRRHQISNDIDI